MVNYYDTRQYGLGNRKFTGKEGVTALECQLGNTLINNW